MLATLALFGVLVTGVLAFTLHRVERDPSFRDYDRNFIATRKLFWLGAAFAALALAQHAVLGADSVIETLRLTGGLFTGFVGGILLSMSVRMGRNANSGRHSGQTASTYRQNAQTARLFGVVMLVSGIVLILV